MQVKEVSYGKTINLGNFESLRTDLKASVDDGEDPKTVIDQLAAEAKAWRKSKETPATA